MDTSDVVIKLLQRQLKDAQEAYKFGKQNNAPDLKALEKAVEEAKRVLDKYTNSDGSDRNRLTEKYLSDYYDKVGEWVRDLVKQFPDLTQLFSRAVSQGWNRDRFLREVYKSDWWAEQKAAGRGNRWLQAFVDENDPSRQGAWVDSIETVKQKIVDLADSLYNMQLNPDDLDKIARRYLYQGWDASDERGLRVWLARQLGKQEGEDGQDFTPGGQYAELERSFRNYVRGFGLQRTEDWYANTAASILNPDSGVTADDVLNEMIAEAESLYPSLAGKLSKDRTVRDVANGYIGWASQILELDPESIELTDPAIAAALGYGSADNATTMPMWEYRKMLRRDPRWQSTDNALSSYSDLASTFLRSMGMVG